ncbi:MAG: ABC-2 family transporter protein [Sellimonas intestinalis]
MDTFLVRPASPFIQMLGQVMHFQAILSMAVYVGILVWSIRGIGLSIGVREIILLIEYIICGTMINSGIYTIFNTLNFWIVQGDDIAVLVQTCREFVKYPLQVFPTAIQGLFTYILPLGFVAYYPVLGLLGKTRMPVMILLPCVAVLTVVIASVLWRMGLKGYNSTGT